MSKGIDRFFPVYEPKRRRIAMDIPLSIVEPADRIRKSRMLTWTEMMQGLLLKAIEDLSPKDPPGFKLKQMSLIPEEDPDLPAKFGARPK